MYRKGRKPTEEQNLSPQSRITFFSHCPFKVYAYEMVSGNQVLGQFLRIVTLLCRHFIGADLYLPYHCRGRRLHSHSRCLPGSAGQLYTRLSAETEKNQQGKAWPVHFSF